MAISELNRIFHGDDEKAEFVAECEADFERRLNGISEQILEISEHNKIFTFSGPTCSGKTTAANKIVRDLSRDGKRVLKVSLDDFFHGRIMPHDEAVRLGAKVDYDSISSVDLPYMEECLHAVCNDRPVELPVYDFDAGKRVGYRHEEPSRYDFVLIEGIQAVYPEVTAILEPYGCCGVYVSVEGGMNVYGKYFSSSDIRFLRRLVRDCKFRFSSLDFTFYYWRTVMENEEKNIIPNEKTQDIRLDSAMLYEIPMIKPFADELLCEVKPGDRYYEQSSALYEKLRGIYTIDSRFLPAGSYYHEFIG